MTSAYHDYQQFLGWLHQPGRGAPEDVLRFANMTLAHFAAVAATTNRQSQRSTTLAAVARAGLAQASPAPLPPGAAAATGAWAWSSLSSLTIGPFRGFRYAETFNFPRRITTFSGPNGSGKTSLCEALELALLGSVDEAGFKRIAPERYFVGPDLFAFQPAASGGAGSLNAWTARLCSMRAQLGDRAAAWHRHK